MELKPFDDTWRAVHSFWCRASVRLEALRTHIVPPPVLPHPGHKADAWVEAHYSQLKNFDIISFDIFDTLLLRTVQHPTDVYKLVAIAAAEEFGPASCDFYDVRRRAEELAKRKALATRATEEVTLDEIYANLSLLVPGCWEFALQKLKQLELAVEDRVVHACPLIVSLISKLEKAEKQIVLVSDMYLAPETIRSILGRRNLARAKVFVSCALGASKRTGGLFDEVFKATGAQPGKIAHFGDNHFSDFVQAQGRGFFAIHYVSPWNLKPYVLHNLKRKPPRFQLPGSIALGLAQKNRYGSLEKEFVSNRNFLMRSVGYEIAGPLFLAFTAWCIQSALQSGAERLLFLARDGYFLGKTFDKIKEALRISIDSKYVFASRRLLLIASLKALDKRGLDVLLESTPGMTLRHFLERAGLAPEACLRLAEDYGFHDPDRVLTTHQFSFISQEVRDSLQCLFLQLEEAVLENAARERDLLHGYLRSCDFSGHRDAIVDVGWHASNLRLLNQINIALHGRDGLRGYYFGTWDKAAAACSEHCQLSSYYMHLGQPHRRSAIIQECLGLLELIFNAPHPTVVGLSREDAGWSPIYGMNEHSDSQSEALKTIHSAGLQFVDDFLALESRAIFQGGMEEYLDHALERLLAFPTPEEGAFFGEFSHRDGFGGISPTRQIAKLPSLAEQIRDPACIQTAYRNCHWKKGMRVQMNRSQLALLEGAGA